jgi:hypothetical protein
MPRTSWAAAQQNETDKEKDMKLNKNIWQIAAVIGLLVAPAASAADLGNNLGNDHGNRNKVVEPGQEYQDKTYNELASEWTNWFVKEPIATNPAFDPDGRFCDRNQQGKVWFLASTFEGVVNRTCEVPADKAIFLSLGGAFVSFAPEFPAAGDPCLKMATRLEAVRCDVNNDVPVAPSVSFTVTPSSPISGSLRETAPPRWPTGTSCS